MQAAAGKTKRLRVDLRQSLAVLSDALDYVGVDATYHGKRVGLMAMRVAKACGLSEAAIERVARASLVHDVGVSSSAERRKLFAFEPKSSAEQHSIQGAEWLTRVPALRDLAPLIRRHHTPWRQMPDDDSEERVLANLIFLCDRADVLSRFNGETPASEHGMQVVAELAVHAGMLFSPVLVDCFEEVASPRFWEELEPANLRAAWSDWMHQHHELIGGDDMLRVAHVFAHVVDGKSTHTAEHSAGVARLALALASEIGLPEEETASVRLAAQLHDIGKLRLPEEILDKEGPLTDHEFSMVRLHAQDTYDLLSRIDGFEEIASWAGMHHARLDGSGYGYEGAPTEIPLEARVIAVADIFQALAQRRPYRESQQSGSIARYLREEAAAGHLDGDVVEAAVRSPEDSWALCLRGSQAGEGDGR